MSTLDPDAPLTQEEKHMLDQRLEVAWTSVVASSKIEDIEVPKDMKRPDDALELTPREARRLIYIGTRF